MAASSFLADEDFDLFGDDSPAPVVKKEAPKKRKQDNEPPAKRQRVAKRKKGVTLVTKLKRERRKTVVDEHAEAELHRASDIAFVDTATATARVDPSTRVHRFPVKTETARSKPATGAEQPSFVPINQVAPGSRNDIHKLKQELAKIKSTLATATRMLKTTRHAKDLTKLPAQIERYCKKLDSALSSLGEMPLDIDRAQSRAVILAVAQGRNWRTQPHSRIHGLVYNPFTASREDELVNRLNRSVAPVSQHTVDLKVADQQNAIQRALAAELEALSATETSTERIAAAQATLHTLYKRAIDSTTTLHSEQRTEHYANLDAWRRMTNSIFQLRTPARSAQPLSTVAPLPHVDPLRDVTAVLPPAYPPDQQS